MHQRAEFPAISYLSTHSPKSQLPYRNSRSNGNADGRPACRSVLCWRPMSPSLASGANCSKGLINATRSAAAAARTKANRRPPRAAQLQRRHYILRKTRYTVRLPASSRSRRLDCLAFRCLLREKCALVFQAYLAGRRPRNCYCLPAPTWWILRYFGGSFFVWVVVHYWLW